MTSENSTLDESTLDQSNQTIVTPIGDMFAKPIQNGILTRSTLITGLANLTLHKEIESYFCFTELTLINLVK